MSSVFEQSLTALIAHSGPKRYVFVERVRTQSAWHSTCNTSKSFLYSHVIAVRPGHNRLRQWLCSAHQVSRITLMTRRALALACALLTAAVSVARASDRAEGSAVATNVASKLDRALLARVQSAPGRAAAFARHRPDRRWTPGIAVHRGGQWHPWPVFRVARRPGRHRAGRGARPRWPGGRKSRASASIARCAGRWTARRRPPARVGSTSTSVSRARASASPPSTRASAPGTTISTAGSFTSPISSTPRRSPTTTTDTERTSPASSPAAAGPRPATAPRLRRQEGRERPPARRGARCPPRRAQGARRQRQRLHEQRHRRYRLRDRQPHDLQHPGPQPLGGRRRLRIVHHGSADPRRQARRRLRHCRRRGCRQPRPRRSGTTCSTAGSPRPATRHGC